MRGVDSPSFWSSFPHDPRDPAHASLRASDRDREVVHRALADAYAEGRLDREEHDERSATVTRAKTLGELPPVVADLLPALATRAPVNELLRVTPGELQQRAEAAWRKDLREAVGAFLVPSLVCVVIWLAVNRGEYADSYFWPMWVMLGTGINLLQAVLRRGRIVAEHRRRLEKKQAKEQRRRELGS